MVENPMAKCMIYTRMFRQSIVSRSLVSRHVSTFCQSYPDSEAVAHVQRMMTDKHELRVTSSVRLHGRNFKQLRTADYDSPFSLVVRRYKVQDRRQCRLVRARVPPHPRCCPRRCRNRRCRASLNTGLRPSGGPRVIARIATVE